MHHGQSKPLFPPRGDEIRARGLATRDDAMRHHCTICGSPPGIDCLAVTVPGALPFIHDERFEVAYRNTPEARKRWG